MAKLRQELMNAFKEGVDAYYGPNAHRRLSDGMVCHPTVTDGGISGCNFNDNHVCERCGQLDHMAIVNVMHRETDT